MVEGFDHELHQLTKHLRIFGPAGDLECIANFNPSEGICGGTSQNGFFAMMILCGGKSTGCRLLGQSFENRDESAAKDRQKRKYIVPFSSHTQSPHTPAGDHKGENLAQGIGENTDGAASGKRRRIANLTERLAAAYIALGLVPEPLRSTGSAKDITRFVEADHNVLHALGGNTCPQNLNLLPRPAHREKSRRDTAIAAKVKRIADTQAEFWRRINAKQHGLALAAPRLTRRGHRPLPCGRDSPWRKPLMSNAVRRVR
jgi:hypothetical protein